MICTDFLLPEKGSRSCPLLNYFNGTSLAVLYWKLRMDTYGLVSIQPSQPKQAILRNGFNFNVFFSVAYAPLDLGGEWLVVHWLKMIT